MYNMLNSIHFNSVKNLTTIYSEQVMYGIDWNTGLSWHRANGQGCPYYSEAFKVNFNMGKLDKPFKGC